MERIDAGPRVVIQAGAWLGVKTERYGAGRAEDSWAWRRRQLMRLWS